MLDIGMLAIALGSFAALYGYLHLCDWLDSQELQFELAPPAARRELARSANASTTDIVNAAVARVSPNVLPEQAAATARRWRYLGAMTEAQQEDVLTRSVIERTSPQIDCLP